MKSLQSGNDLEETLQTVLRKALATSRSAFALDGLVETLQILGKNPSSATVEAVAGSAAAVADDLHRVVDDLILEVGGFRLEAHERALARLHAWVSEDELGCCVDVDALQRKLMEPREPMFELVYAMDDQGVQITDNVPHPAYRHHISTAGNGVNRAHKDYWREVMETGNGYASPIYRSEATQALCVTVSYPLRDKSGHLWAVLAADIHLAGLLQLG